MVISTAEQDSAISQQAGYRALKSIDSYQHVRDGAAYPAVLLTTGVTDPRVGPFHVAKMAARLQAASRSGKPILLRVDFDAALAFAQGGGHFLYIVANAGNDTHSGDDDTSHMHSLRKR